MIFPVFVPSKGRPHSSTLEVLAADSVPLSLVIEPQEFPAYRDVFLKLVPEGSPARQRSRLVLLPENNRGIGYVRNFILKTARDEGQTWYWMLDDDITGFVASDNGRNRAIKPSEALAFAQNIFLAVRGGPVPVGQAALEYQQYAWRRGKRDFALNSYCDVAVAINAVVTGDLVYRETLNGKEDRDFTLQVLAAGLLTLRVQKYGFAAPKNGSNKGGLKPKYDTEGWEADVSRRLANAWPGVVTCQTKKDGRPDAKINWKVAFRTRP